MRLSEQILRFFGRVEVALVGADGALRDAEEALIAGDALRARAAAHAVLARVPKSPIGLALLADACELGGLHAELALTLEELAARLGSRAEVWLRLAGARERTSMPTGEVREALLRGLAVAEPGSETRRELLTSLADLDLRDGDAARADLWLDRLLADDHPAVQLRRGEVRLLQGRLDEAEALLGAFADDPTHARAALALGRVYSAQKSPKAYTSLLRAFLLDQPQAGHELRRALALIPIDTDTLTRIRAVCMEKADDDHDRWNAAFFRAEGQTEQARHALRRACEQGDAESAEALLTISLADRDVDGLRSALSVAPRSAQARDASRVLAAALSPRELEHALLGIDALAELESDTSAPWAHALRIELTRVLLPAGRPGAWDALLGRLDAVARELGDPSSQHALGAVMVERSRPLRLAVIGEFNAGKSTFLNALLGQDIAPTGILPTTATLHHVRYAPDPLARICLDDSADGARERLVGLADLRATLKDLDTGTVARVEILVPLPSLTRMEILDTPGFNAPDPRHAVAAREALAEADVLLWLFDAAQTLKASERRILDEARALDLPLQVLINKADRLAPADLAKVMTAVEQGLAELELRPLAPPLAFSARLALQGRLGDAEALVASRFEDVQRLVEEQLVARSAELKERALRRRLASVVRELADTLGARRERHERALETHERERVRARQLAVRLETRIDDLGEELARFVEPSADAWRRDVSTASIGRDRSHAERDPAHQRYVLDRAMVHLVPALSSAAFAVLDGQDASIRAWLPALLQPNANADDLGFLARAVVRSHAAAGAAAPSVDLTRSFLLAMADWLTRQSLQPPPRDPVLAHGLELDALAHVLQTPSPPSA